MQGKADNKIKVIIMTIQGIIEKATNDDTDITEEEIKSESGHWDFSAIISQIGTSEGEVCAKVINVNDAQTLINAARISGTDKLDDQSTFSFWEGLYEYCNQLITGIMIEDEDSYLF